VISLVKIELDFSVEYLALVDRAVNLTNMLRMKQNQPPLMRDQVLKSCITTGLSQTIAEIENIGPLPQNPVEPTSEQMAKAVSEFDRKPPA